eukprot:13759029-Heterocapsa_arctica.AAC.1
MLSRARVHLNICFELYNMLLSEGRYFLHEHPATATSWSDPKVVVFMKKAGVVSSIMHACQYGMTARRSDGTYGPSYKPTKWLSNSPAILARLAR